MKKLIRPLLLLAVAAALVLWFFTAVGSVEQSAAEEGKRQLEFALHRGAVACYAAEGFYPPTLEYLCENYGVELDESRYIVFYEVEAENLMPSIKVLERKL